MDFLIWSKNFLLEMFQLLPSPLLEIIFTLVTLDDPVCSWYCLNKLCYEVYKVLRDRLCSTCLKYIETCSPFRDVGTLDQLRHKRIRIEFELPNRDQRWDILNNMFVFGPVFGPALIAYIKHIFDRDAFNSHMSLFSQLTRYERYDVILWLLRNELIHTVSDQFETRVTIILSTNETMVSRVARLYEKHPTFIGRADRLAKYWSKLNETGIIWDKIGGSETYKGEILIPNFRAIISVPFFRESLWTASILTTTFLKHPPPFIHPSRLLEYGISCSLYKTWQRHCFDKSCHCLWTNITMLRHATECQTCLNELSSCKNLRAHSCEIVKNEDFGFSLLSKLINKLSDDELVDLIIKLEVEVYEVAVVLIKDLNKLDVYERVLDCFLRPIRQDTIGRNGFSKEPSRVEMMMIEKLKLQNDKLLAAQLENEKILDQKQKEMIEFDKQSKNQPQQFDDLDDMLDLDPFESDGDHDDEDGDHDEDGEDGEDEDEI